MGKLFKAIAVVSYGTGGMRGPNGSRQYWTGKGVAFGHSPKNALRQARRLADSACGEGAAWIPVWEFESVCDAHTGKDVKLD